MARLDRYTKQWIRDRVVNREALMWNEFIIFLRNMGASERLLNKWNSKSYRAAAKKKLYVVEK